MKTLVNPGVRKYYTPISLVVSVPPKFGPFYIVGRSTNLAGLADGLSDTSVYFVAFEPSCWYVTTVPHVGSLDLA